MISSVFSDIKQIKPLYIRLRQVWSGCFIIRLRNLTTIKTNKIERENNA
ncbi:hypothetical protein HMPREF0201_00076 [Cedecea davisae DSM 4568]|uniref:Uncharacterized protein n=1 Tax=Cedecea davisae DSM 4568 TaxID=566551 RepID=S3J559_9ENTR|nr:hypothetical protein HMPREF0201_00076 [Cedecea davisae DSM 4568]